jgi:ribonuclease D
LVHDPRAPAVVTTPSDLARVVGAARGAALVSVDVEGNGLFAYRSRLCTVQLAWGLGDEANIAIVDTLAVDPKPLGELFSAGGPPKVLHDFTFDVKLLADAGIELANVRDTSVLARLLGRKATGLASLLASELGITVAKDLQQHDWSQRPLDPPQIEYLAGDVRHLAALFAKLVAEARALDIEEEVEVECAFKREGALAPPRERRPAYLRVKGAELLDAPSLAVLRRVYLEREQIAEQWDVPPFKVAGNDVLLGLAQAKPKSVAELARVRRGVSSRFLEVGARVVAAVQAGLAEGRVPAADVERPARPDKQIVAARRAREKRLSGWRRVEAKARGVDEQVVLPGHCLSDLVDLEKFDAASIASVRGMGPKRLARYGAALAELLRGDGATPPAAAPAASETEP